MKYLLKHTKETILTAIMIVVMAYILYRGIKNGETIQSIIEMITYVLVWYYNMPTSIEGHAAKLDIKENKESRDMITPYIEEPEDSEVGDDEC